MKAGMVAIVGRPNAGKSTLLNALAGEKVAIVSPVPQTTRHQIRAVFNDPRGQSGFLDTPGMHKSEGAFERAMSAAIQGALSGADVALHIVDVTEPPGFEESMVMDLLASSRTPVILALNKIDRGLAHLDLYLKAWEAKLGSSLSAVTDRVMPLPLSAAKGTNIDKLLEEIFRRLPEGPALYPDDVLTDFPRQLTIQDIVREKMLLQLRDELPFSIAVYAEEILDRGEKRTYAKLVILVERESQKAIVIGHRGQALKRVGVEARRELEALYGKKFFLDIWVKVDPRWKQNTELLRRIGYIV